MKFRKLYFLDYYKNYFYLLQQLTKAPVVTTDQFNDQLEIINKNPFHHIYVLEENNKIICTGTLIIEPKFIHNCGLVGHIEDIIVDENYNGLGIGGKLIEHLTEIAKRTGCYKVILNCSTNVEKFYKKCGYDINGNCMVKYFKID